MSAAKRAQPRQLADAGKRRKVDALHERSVVALERIAAALERLAIVPMPDPSLRMLLREADVPAKGARHG